MEIIVNVPNVNDREVIREGVRKVVDRVSEGLDLTLLEAIVVPNDFGEEVVAFQRSKGIREGFTDEEYARAFGKSLLYFENGEPKVTIFIDASIAYGFFNSDQGQFCGNILHHELCHAHDDFIKYNDIGGELIREYGRNFQDVLRIHADSIWSEYIAVKLSFSTSDLNQEDPFRTTFLISLIDITQQKVEEDIQRCIEEQDWVGLYVCTQLNCSQLLKQVATVLANFHVVKHNELEKEFNKIIEESYLNEIWSDISAELNVLYATYGEWGSVEVYDKLGEIVKRTWRALHVNVDLEDAGLRVWVSY